MATPVDNMPPIHPGEFLREELDELGLSARAFADALDVPHNRIAAILRGERAVTADTALRLAAYFGTSADVWMNLQKTYDLKRTELEHGAEIRAAVKSPAGQPH
jgi:antitoxin HigA-1